LDEQPFVLRSEMKAANRVPVVPRPVRRPCGFPCLSCGIVILQKLQVMPFAIPQNISLLVSAHLPRWEVEPFHVIRSGSITYLPTEVVAMPAKHPKQVKLAAIVWVQSGHRSRSIASVTRPTKFNIFSMRSHTSSSIHTTSIARREFFLRPHGPLRKFVPSR